MKLSISRGQNSNPMNDMGHHGSIFPLSVNVSETFGDIKFSFARAQTNSEVLLYFGDTFKGGENYNARRYYRRITLIYAHLLFEMNIVI